MTGLFITFEGVDGAGKSTQIRKAAERLTARGASVFLTREPGGSPGAEEIRKLLVSGEPGRWSAETELLLFTAARRDHLERGVEPALARGDIVLCDRYVDSTRAYQAAARGGDAGMVEALHNLMIARDPDLTLIFDIDPEVAEARRLAEGDAAPRVSESRFERFGVEFQTALRRAFRNIAEAEPDRCRVIDASGRATEVAERTHAAIEALLRERGADLAEGGA